MEFTSYAWFGPKRVYFWVVILPHVAPLYKFKRIRRKSTSIERDFSGSLLTLLISLKCSGHFLKKFGNYFTCGSRKSVLHTVNSGSFRASVAHNLHSRCASSFMQGCRPTLTSAPNKSLLSQEVPARHDGPVLSTSNYIYCST